ncbi:hypothetical protein DAI22_01g317600 [Oryza sativa Japonica Group]|nr:hypothetical protein DAI22_01g317600 [Oryza sativa Japonica Group]
MREYIDTVVHSYSCRPSPHNLNPASIRKQGKPKKGKRGLEPRPNSKPAMATAAGGARRALAGLRSASSSRAFSQPAPAAAAARSPELAAFSLPRSTRRRPAISRVPVEALGGAHGLMPLHSATASALLTSMLGLKPGSWGWLSEGFATPL